MPATLKHQQNLLQSQGNDAQYQAMVAQSNATATFCNAISSGIVTVADSRKLPPMEEISRRGGQATTESALFSAAKNIGQLPPPAKNPELQRMMHVLGPPSSRVLGPNGAVLDAAMTRSIVPATMALGTTLLLCLPTPALLQCDEPLEEEVAKNPPFRVLVINPRTVLLLFRMLIGHLQ